ncbi:type II toxin-antitoxin system RelE/ParE family toxin [Duganella sp. LX20W]|uniref:Type II toxin-antitoxin system RelE/ParE family toxin n=1 Tax=Rugamonas brunnea TaxID=2758569 RepID=A0A7W2EPQ7_9BURK|nr:type II toxin-antitoxin system RelE/ParE family toxin [Rugamonas brunnea]MBA5636376.1 type II toxin-antitoxin system RelE/ParE family toxin [Rugamonas brunnea]
MKRVIRTATYLSDLDDIWRFVARDSPQAATNLWARIDAQVDRLADPNFPRRRGRVKGTVELIAHRNYIVILLEDADAVIALNVVHAKKRYP